MVDGEKYSKQEVTNYLASQGLVYSGLDEHFNDWFEEYIMDYGFEDIGNSFYIYHEDEW